MSTEPLRVPNGETYREKALRKFKQQPLVPLGALATTFTLLMASNKLRKRQSKDMNYWLRARVIAQGFTIAAVVAGAWMMGQTKPQIDKSAREQDEMLDGLQRRREEFEERLRNAEENHRLEQEVLNAPSSEATGTPVIRDINAQPLQATQVSSMWNPLGWFKGSNPK
ncbi:hypothetical protein BDM02DRAFT_3189881 [Thelephora ganbajun]|uniref:Uncharacterized protein n=1 Tax=Thelephora ganbajun TaxID=370292 RepID=A0ACB6Z684_THEGA|nr:hypothetical protein BDM02DRAFT_3189881 [Thelephora ganbajun]